MKNGTIKIACVIGTRPEAIKMAPVIYQLKKHPEFKITLISSGQHRELLADMENLFGLKPDLKLNIMKKNQSLGALTGRLFLKLDAIIKKNQYDIILAQGDTTTVLVTATLCFYHRIPFGHVEAGLRSYDFDHPFPEEMNRVVVSKEAELNFAPTEDEKRYLIKENIPKKKIFVTGNTVIDTLLLMTKKQVVMPFTLPRNKRIILVTVHHRDNFGKPLLDIFKAIIQLTKLFTDIVIVFPVHPNPNVRELAYKMLANNKSIILTKPLQYDVFIKVMQKSYFIMTDSGGIEEEAPALNKPVIVLRTETERFKIIKLGLGKLVGTDVNAIVKCASELLSKPKKYQAMIKNISPYGDGHAAKRIVNIILNYFKKVR